MIAAGRQARALAPSGGVDRQTLIAAASAEWAQPVLEANSLGWIRPTSTERPGAGSRDSNEYFTPAVRIFTVDGLHTGRETNMSATDPTDGAYERGRRIGLATGALALSVVAFVNLLGLEKSILATILALLALRGGASVAEGARRARLALVVAVIHMITIVAVLAIFHDKLLQLLHLLEKLG
jgi:hypothetical protein